MEQRIFPGELLVLHLYLGGLTLLIAGALYAGFLFRGWEGRTRVSVGWRVAALISSLFGAYALSLGLWLFWPFPIDIMLGPISLPVLIAQLFTTFVTLLGLFGLSRRKK